jgi:glycerol-3-phosphate cytidylyltransferase-like family protein
MTINLDNSALEPRTRAALREAMSSVDEVITGNDDRRRSQLIGDLGSWLVVLDDAIHVTSGQISAIQNDDPADPLVTGMSALKDNYLATRPIVNELLDLVRADDQRPGSSLGCV